MLRKNVITLCVSTIFGGGVLATDAALAFPLPPPGPGMAG